MMLAAIALLLASAKAQIVGASRMLTNAGGENAAYTGIGRFSGPLTCTAFFIRPPQALETSPAYVMAAGHCIDTSSANQVIRDRALTNARVTFNYFRDTQTSQITVPAKAAVYATMKGLDVSVIELNTTFGELAKRGVTPLDLADSVAREVKVIGAPYANTPSEEAFLRVATCELGPRVDLIEFFWHFFGAYPNTCSDIASGSSGSPVLSRDTGKVVALMNTTTAGAAIDTGDFPCFNGQPCEVTQGGFVYRRDTNYAVPVSDVNTCFDESGRFSADLASCLLDSGRQLALSAPLRAVQPKSRWNVRVTGEAFPQYRYKVVREGFGDCRDPQGYGALTNASLINDELPEIDSRYYLCVLGDGQPARFPTMVHTRVDTTPPSIAIPYTFFDRGDAYLFDPIFVLPELVDFSYKVIEAGGPTCAESDNFARYFRIPVRVPKTSSRFCLIGRDEAGNATPILEFALQGPNVFPTGVVNAATLRRGPLRPGTLASIFGVNLGGQKLELIDGTNRRWPIINLYETDGQINFLIPAGAAIGPAKLALSSGEVVLTLQADAPGLFTAAESGNGAPAGYAIHRTARTPLFACASRGACSPAPVDPPSDGSPFALELFATGISAAPVAEIGGVSLSAEVVLANEGLQTLRVLIPGDFSLRGYLPLRVFSGTTPSNRVYVRFR